jgi:hypothetical protein
MYICLDCFEIFDEPKQCFSEEREHFGMPCRESFSGSPCCQYTYVDAVVCSECWEYIKGHYIRTKSDERVCEGCYDSFEIGDE